METGTMCISPAANTPPQAGEPVASSWTPLTHKGDVMTCPLPADETVVQVMLDDGTACRAWYSCNIMEAGDWDFVPAGDDDEPIAEAESLSDRIIAWRPLSASPSQPVAEAEPVAWQWRKRPWAGSGDDTNHWSNWQFGRIADAIKHEPADYEERPLYAAPQLSPAAQPSATPPDTDAVQVTDACHARKKGGQSKMDITDAMVEAAEAAVYPRHERGFLIKPLVGAIDMRAALTAAIGAGGQAVAYEPCGGCGEKNPDKRCIGCLHPFSALSQPHPADDRVMENRLSKTDVLREWFGGDRYARDYEYLDANFGQQAKQVADFAAALSTKEASNG